MRTFTGEYGDGGSGTSGNLIPSIDGLYVIGTPSIRYDTIYAYVVDAAPDSLEAPSVVRVRTIEDKTGGGGMVTVVSTLVPGTPTSGGWDPQTDVLTLGTAAAPWDRVHTLGVDSIVYSNYYSSKDSPVQVQAHTQQLVLYGEFGVDMTDGAGNGLRVTNGTASNGLVAPTSTVTDLGSAVTPFRAGHFSSVAIGGSDVVQSIATAQATANGNTTSVASLQSQVSGLAATSTSHGTRITDLENAPTPSLLEAPPSYRIVNPLFTAAGTTPVAPSPTTAFVSLSSLPLTAVSWTARLKLRFEPEVTVTTINPGPEGYEEYDWGSVEDQFALGSTTYSNDAVVFNSRRTIRFNGKTIYAPDYLEWYDFPTGDWEVWISFDTATNTFRLFEGADADTSLATVVTGSGWTGFAQPVFLCRDSAGYVYDGVPDPRPGPYEIDFYDEGAITQSADLTTWFVTGVLQRNALTLQGQSRAVLGTGGLLPSPLDGVDPSLGTSGSPWDGIYANTATIGTSLTLAGPLTLAGQNLDTRISQVESDQSAADAAIAALQAEGSDRDFARYTKSYASWRIINVSDPGSQYSALSFQGADSWNMGNPNYVTDYEDVSGWFQKEYTVAPPDGGPDGPENTWVKRLIAPPAGVTRIWIHVSLEWARITTDYPDRIKYRLNDYQAGPTSPVLIAEDPAPQVPGISSTVFGPIDVNANMRLGVNAIVVGTFPQYTVQHLGLTLSVWSGTDDRFLYDAIASAGSSNAWHVDTINSNTSAIGANSGAINSIDARTTSLETRMTSVEGRVTTLEGGGGGGGGSVGGGYVFRGALVYLQNSVTWSFIYDSDPRRITFNNTDYDTSGIYDSANDRFVIPTDGYATFSCGVYNVATVPFVYVSFYVNGSRNTHNAKMRATGSELSWTCGPIAVSQGDTLELKWDCPNPPSLFDFAVEDATWMSVQLF